MTSETRVKLAGLLLLSAAVAGWGLNWPLMKIVLEDWPPLFARGFAGIVAGILMMAIARTRGDVVEIPRGSWRPIGLAAAFNVFAWMGFSTLSMVWLRVSEGALLVYTVPIWVVLFGWLNSRNRPTFRDFVSLAVGFSGIVVLVSGVDFSVGASKLPGVGFALAAAILFAVGSVTLTKQLSTPPLVWTAWQVLLGSVPMVAYGLLVERPSLGALGLAGWGCIAYMILVPMGACYICWFACMQRLPVFTASVGSLGVPIVSALAAAFVLDETIDTRQALAMTLTLGGVVIAAWR